MQCIEFYVNLSYRLIHLWLPSSFYKSEDTGNVALVVVLVVGSGGCVGGDAYCSVIFGGAPEDEGPCELVCVILGVASGGCVVFKKLCYRI